MTKNELRNHAKIIRASIPQLQRDSDAVQLKDNLLQVINEKLVVATYYPIGSEITPPHKINECQMALPVIGDKTTLEFYIWSEGDDLIHGRFDIPIPKRHTAPIDQPDIILLPLLLCDHHGNRLGYGAGHYDRYIASLPSCPKLIGVCFDEQVYEGIIPAETHDIPLDLIITPKRIIEKI